MKVKTNNIVKLTPLNPNVSLGKDDFLQRAMFPVDDKLNTLVHSEEFKEFCNTIYQDFFEVKVCEIPDGGGAEVCAFALSTNIDALCGGVFQADVGFDNGDVYATGWRQLSFPLAAYVGKKVRIRLIAGDQGDSIYDSAILVDNITVTKAGTP
jgi:hypothetical protein